MPRHHRDGVLAQQRGERAGRAAEGLRALARAVGGRVARGPRARRRQVARAARHARRAHRAPSHVPTPHIHTHTSLKGSKVNAKFQ